MGEYNFSLLELKLMHNGILEIIANKNYCGFEESDHHRLANRLKILIFIKEAIKNGLNKEVKTDDK